METITQKDYNIFSALVETIHKKDQKKLRFSKCNKCGRLTPFRLSAISSGSVKCRKCGNKISLKV
ncbi:MAG: hypothetical protein NWF06_00075 [Candidatus Bathyarchaeota archaeon]|nr:hypothetical protein [Candidatus Bathyarchaeum sp.]